MNENKMLNYKKIILITVLVLVCGGLSFFFSSLNLFDSVTKTIALNYSGDASKVIIFELKNVHQGIVIFLVNLVVLTCWMAVVDPVGKNGVGKNGQKWGVLSFAILSFFGFLAYVVLVTLFLAPKLPKNTSFLLTGLITSVYQILNFELFFLGKKNSNKLFWEVYRFALVGLIAAVFDFASCYIVQFLIFKNATDWYVTFLSVTAGFIIGVTINYFLSTYMVYKASKSNMSKTTKGVIIFVVLSAIGLGLGIGIQYLLYDYLNVQKEIAFFSYPVDFVIRTLVVMFYNYVSRKLIIYK